jgi:hypothetical protein
VGERIRLSWLEFDVLWEHFDLGPHQPVLAVPSPGRTASERADVRAMAWASLAAKDLGRPGAPDGRLVRWLAALVRPTWELDARMRLTPNGPGTTALIARTGRHARVAVRGNGDVTLWTVPHDQLVNTAVRLLPSHPPGTGRSTTLPASVVDQAAAGAGTSADRFLRALVAGGLGRSEARRLAEVLGNVVRLAHFGAARNRPDGTRQRASHVVSVYDTPTGRFSFTRRDEWVTLVPGAEATLTRQMDELLAQL